MRTETAELVSPILRQGLRLQERLRRGEKLDLRQEQAELRKLFQTSRGALGTAPAPSTEESGDAFLGVRYPLACWLDEVFILDPQSPWKAEWRDQTLEFALFRRRDRSFLFWEQARLAEARGDADALEVFYLCVMLGFRGDLREDPGGLHDWRESVEAILGRGWSADWTGKPPELPLPETNVPPLRAREHLRWLLLTGSALVGLTILGTVFALVYRLGS
jgi:type VI secretion system protein ImpK